jgi:cyclophilin family peptidyl-prolyl cis-trans isomerase
MERFPKIKHRKLGAISMANNGQDMHGSQVYLFIIINKLIILYCLYF